MTTETERYKQDISYTIAKRLRSITAIDSAYGSFELDAEMALAVERVLLPILERRLEHGGIKL